MENSQEWIGAEAAVGLPLGHRLRRQELSGPSLVGLICGLSFFGGLALGGALACLWRRSSRQPESSAHRDLGESKKDEEILLLTTYPRGRS